MIEPFVIDIVQSEIDDLRARLRATRWPDAAADDWSQGIPLTALQPFVDYWANDYDWRAAERRLNALTHVRSQGVHAVTAGTPGATPLLLVHGWPDSFLRFERALPLLHERFDTVVPSIPGYGFSDRPSEVWGTARIADQFAQLMAALGHERFGVHGADIGSQIVDQLALRHPDRLIGLHLGDVPFRRMRALEPAERTADEREWADRAAEWEISEAGYTHVQRTKPQTLSVPLNDSPAGLAAWILEKFQSWSERGLAGFTFDELATNLTLYWVTQTAGSSVRYYRDSRHTPLNDGYVATPTALAQFPADLLPAPRHSAERFYNVQRFTAMPRGGHFGPWEEPELFSADVIAFFDQLGAWARASRVT